MSRQDDPYIQVYWRLSEEYPQVWDDDKALAWFVRLLKAADGMWPSAADVPVGVPSRTWRLLTDGDDPLVIRDGRRFRIRGMDKRRNARSSAASNAARMRWSNAGRIAMGNAETMPHSTAQHSTAQIPPTPARRGLRANGTNPRAMNAQEGQRRRDIANDLQQRYLRGELSEEQHRDARRQAGLS
jgi:hypothetical protein